MVIDFRKARCLATLGGIALAFGSQEALAQGPEQLEQLEPDGGEWQAQYYGEFGSTEDFGRAHALEFVYGISDAVAAGIELEGEAEDGTFTLDEAGLISLFRLMGGEDAPFGLGMKLSAGFEGGVSLSEAEARLIAELRKSGWYGQANLMVRHERGESGRGEVLAYGWNLSHAVADRFYLGVEGSGQAARLGGFDDAYDEGFEKAHFIGPAAEFALDLGDGEIELGLAWLGRLSGEGPASTVRVNIQIDF